jgi:exodeoxyribonuclease-3
MRVISLNLNGIRSATRKGFMDWLPAQHADFVCLQELKAQKEQIDEPLYYPEGYHCYYHSAERKGYSGVGLYSKKEPDDVIEGIGWEDVDAEGRYIEGRFGQLSIISLYLQSGSSSDERQQVKFDFLDRFMPYLKSLKRKKRDYIIAGDWNIAHKEIDLKNWKGNQKNSGFLPEERAWMDELFGKAGYIDAFREIEQLPDQYTWWSNRGEAWAKNVGWRIDYQVVSKAFKGTVRNTHIYKDERFSDHAPLIIDYDYET